jgi:hypothetical protein
MIKKLDACFCRSIWYLAVNGKEICTESTAVGEDFRLTSKWGHARSVWKVGIRYSKILALGKDDGFK